MHVIYICLPSKTKLRKFVTKKERLFQALDNVLCALIPTNLIENLQLPALNFGIHIAYKFINNTYIPLIISV